MRKFLFLFLVPGLLFCQRVAITLDDAPFGASGGMTETEKVAAFDGILDALEKHEITATFFITTGNLTKKNRAILDKAKVAGHRFGNHTHGHLNLNNVTADEYNADIDRCAKEAGEWIDTRYFRYSYLRRGDTDAKRMAVMDHLTERKLTIAPVTIDNDEWIYNRDYVTAKTDAEKDQTVEDYLRHMSDVSEKYRKLSLEIAGREISHILLIHVNPINCDHLDSLLAQYKNSGWKFVSLDEAMQDSFYELPENYIGPHGISQIDRIRKSQD